MDVIDGLPGSRTAVEDRSIAVVESLVFCQLSCDREQVTHQGLVYLIEIVEAGDRLTGNDQYVGRRLWIDISKGDARVVLIHHVGRYVTVRDLLE